MASRAGVSPKQRIDRESILAAGMSIAARPSAPAVTVRELGKYLGADPTSIYRHFRNKEDVMRALLENLMAEILLRVTAPREQWRERLRQMAAATFELYMEYPAIGAEAIHLSTNGPAELNIVEIMLECMEAAGLSDEEAVRHYAAVSTYVLAYASGIASSYSDRDSENPEEATAWLSRSLPMSPATHPRVNALRSALISLDDRDAYNMGVEALLDAIEANAGRTRKP
ncbi:MAG: TetR/AcrR family transcriptional regulator C-terminal domain-containing protein [Specibacter sp.]